MKRRSGKKVVCVGAGEAGRVGERERRGFGGRAGVRMRGRERGEEK